MVVFTDFTDSTAAELMVESLGRLLRRHLVLFVVLQALTMGCFGLANANFNAMAMQDMGGIAGTASSVQGFISVTMGAVIGMSIGQSFAGTTLPLHVGTLCCALSALVIIAVTERGRLFRPH